MSARLFDLDLSIATGITAVCCLDCPRHAPFTVEGELEDAWAQMKEHQKRTHHRVAATFTRTKRPIKQGRNGSNRATD